jgi:hypothetical protein
LCIAQAAFYASVVRCQANFLRRSKWRLAIRIIELNNDKTMTCDIRRRAFARSGWAEMARRRIRPARGIERLESVL